MGRSRNLSKLLVDANGDVDAASLDNVPPSDDASALTTGTLPIARIADGAVTATKLASTLDLTSKTVTLPAGVGGKVLQVVQSTNTTQQSTTSASATATGITASITPSSSSSKIFVFCNFTGQVSGASLTAYFSLYKGGTNITSPQGTRLESAAANWFGTQVLSILDSPSTTSSTTYTLYFWAQSGATATVNISSSPGRMILMEIAA
jgi:hypothetical protein